jgi:heptosyltransferase II
MSETPRRVVVLAPNWLGDAVMALPLVRDLRLAWPEAHLAVAGRKGVAPLYSMVPGVDEVMALSREGDAARLAAGKFDAALLLPNSFASAWLTKQANIPQRWGYARDLRSPLLTRAIPRPRTYGHQVEYYQALGAALEVVPGPPYAAVAVPSAAVVSATSLLHGRGLQPGRAFVVFAPGAAYGRAKQWLPSRFVELSHLLHRDGVATVLVGAAGDVAACAEIAAATPVINLAAETDLLTLAGVLAQARGVVANDSGAMHLAAAVGVPVTAIFGPTDDRKTAPLRARADAPAPVIVATSVWCRPCMLRECPIDHRCMTGIDAARVYAAGTLARPGA